MDNLKIALIVSDEKEIRSRFAGLLQKCGVAYILESDKIQALTRILEVNVKVIIVDMSVVEENGIDFLRLLKRLRPRLPILAITKELPEERHHQLLDAGAMYVFVNRMKDEQYEATVAALLEEG